MPTSLLCDSQAWEERAAIEKQRIVQRGVLTSSECRGSTWCLMFPIHSSRGKRIFENGGDFVLKVNSPLDGDGELHEESQEMRLLCARARGQSSEPSVNAASKSGREDGGG